MKLTKNQVDKAEQNFEQSLGILAFSTKNK